MKKHHTKDKGDLGVLKAAADLQEKGFSILFPVSEHQHFDLVAYKDTQFKRVQVKYRSVYKGALTITFKGAFVDKKGIHYNKMHLEEVDVFAVYCPELNQVFYVSATELVDKKTFALRVEAPKNGQMKGINLSRDYLQVP